MPAPCFVFNGSAGLVHSPQISLEGGEAYADLCRRGVHKAFHSLVHLAEESTRPYGLEENVQLSLTLLRPGSVSY